MRRFGLYGKRLVRFSEKLDKITMLDWLLHLFQIHVIRTSRFGEVYCRLCGKVFEE